MFRGTTVALALLALATTACDVETTLRPDGSGKLRVHYHLDKNATIASVAQKLAAPSVMVRSARIDRRGYGTFKVRFADVTTLSSAAMFKNVAVQSAPGTRPGTVDWSAAVSQPKPITLPEKLIEHYGNDLRVRVTFPGPIVATNATSHEGAVATWVVPLRDMSSRPETRFTATYEAPG
jgi:hypothetical protein